MHKKNDTTYRLSAVWLFLCTVTVLSLISSKRTDLLGAMGSLLIFSLSYVKAELILMEFLNLKISSPSWKNGFRACVGGLLFLLFGLYMV